MGVYSYEELQKMGINIKEMEKYDFYYTSKTFPYKEVAKRANKRIVYKLKGSRKKSAKEIKNAYINTPCAFDIETTTVSYGDVHFAFMYQWQFDIMIEDVHYVCFGRTAEELKTFVSNMHYALGLSEKKKLVVYVHNLAYEYQFLKNFFDTERLFATEKRKPLTWEIIDHFEFRCSYRLSNMSLAKFCENSEGVKHYKQQGTYDYSLKRTPVSPLTKEELQYCYNDVAGLCECIADRLKEDTIATIPLTSTGYVRRDYQREVSKNKKYHDWFQDTALDVETFEMARLAFRGGDTCANPIYTGKLLEYVISYDIQSSYPAIMAYENRFPIGKWEAVDFKPEYLETHACLFKACFSDIELKSTQTCPYIDVAHLHNAKDVKNVNGRMLSAKYCEIYITEIDFKIIMQEYNIKGDIEIEDFRISERGMLPKEIRTVLMKLYTSKTQLKGVQGMEYEYSKSKNRVNASYGMCVTNPINDIVKDYVHTDGWKVEPNEDIEGTLDAYYDNASHFLHYTWGVFITCMARERLREMIHYLGDRFVYADTDSVKFLTTNRFKDEKYINKLNKQIIRKGKRVTPQATAFRGDKEFPLGIWDFDNDTQEGYRYFKTFGAKKYAYECYDKKGNYGLHITVAGCSKSASKILEAKAKQDGVKPIDEFRIGMILDKMEIDGEIVTSGRTVSWYNDLKKSEEIIVDGVKIKNGSNIAICESSYTLGISDEYDRILKSEFSNNIEVNLTDDI